MGKCKSCAHPARAEIDRALVAGHPLRSLEGQYGISKSSLADHKRNHLGEALRSAAARAGEQREDGLLADVREFKGEVRKILREARRTGDHPAALASIGALLRLIEVEGRMRPPQAADGPPAFSLEITQLGYRTRKGTVVEAEADVPEQTSARPLLAPPALEPDEVLPPPPEPERARSVARPARAREKVSQTADPWMRSNAVAEDEENRAAAEGSGRSRFRDF
ncbi:MAG: hypothetical protein WEB59_01960 [Thermoanaerobaculia bacterium]